MKGNGVRGAVTTALMICMLGMSACGGGDGSSEAPEVGDCIDVDNAVVSCSSDEAAMTLTSDQSEPNATACIAISDPPEVEVTIGDDEFCAQPK